MKYVNDISKSLRRFMFPSLLTFMLVYTGYNTITGERGVMMWLNLNKEVELVKQENVELSNTKLNLEKKVAKLQAKNLDVDYVDELIRRNLPVLQKNENMYFLDNHM